MGKLNYYPDVDQFDEKVFRERLGTFGTTTKPGGNQLDELQIKIRQGVKNVELHLNNSGKGNGGTLDTPDKYGFKERRSIMQLAKLNKVNLSVHATLDTVSLSGLGNKGFDEAKSWSAIKEIDETLKFAAETARGGAVVTHLQGEGVTSSHSQLNLSRRYLDWVKKNKPDEYIRLKKDYLKENSLRKKFVDNPLFETEIKSKYENLPSNVKREFEQKYRREIEKGQEPWEVYHIKTELDKIKIAPELYPAVIVGGQVKEVQRLKEIVDIDKLITKEGFTEEEIEALKKLRVDLAEDFDLEDFQKAMALFTNGQLKSKKVDPKVFQSLKDKLLIDYDKILEKNDYLQNLADAEFYKKIVDTELKLYNLKKKNLIQKKEIFQTEYDRIRDLEKDLKKAFKRMEKIDEESPEGKAARDILKNYISEKNDELQKLKYNVVGMDNYNELARFDETIASINKEKKELLKQQNKIQSLNEGSFDKNSSGLAYLGLNALKYQLELKAKAKNVNKVLPKLQDELKSLREQYYSAKDSVTQDKLADQISELEYKISKFTGLKDYEDIDLENRPLYISPENMLPGMGSLTSIEELKAIIRMSQEDFAKRILSDEDEFKAIREKYEKETGKKIKSFDDAISLAKKHIAGTFDTAHAGSWLKHFRRKKGESEEARLARFNKWIQDEAESMLKEGLIKHIHFNNTSGKDDDHNLLGSGILDMHKLRKIFRNANIDEALIVEAGGRGADKILHLIDTFEMFNPLVSEFQRDQINVSSGVSDWISTDRDYKRRPVYSNYGMNPNTFVHTQPKDESARGGWSGTSFF